MMQEKGFFFGLRQIEILQLWTVHHVHQFGESIVPNQILWMGQSKVKAEGSVALTSQWGTTNWQKCWSFGRFWNYIDIKSILYIYIHMILFDVFQKFVSQNSRDEWLKNQPSDDPQKTNARLNLAGCNMLGAVMTGWSKHLSALFLSYHWAVNLQYL